MAAGKPCYDELTELVRQQAEENERLKRRIAELEKQVQTLQEQLQAAQRQAGPFRRRENLKKPRTEMKPSGRKEGYAGAYRQRPARIDHEVEVLLEGCPHCEGSSHKCIAHHLRTFKEHEQTLRKRGVESQYLLLWKLLLKDAIGTWKEGAQMEPVAYARKVL